MHPRFSAMSGDGKDTVVENFGLQEVVFLCQLAEWAVTQLSKSKAVASIHTAGECITDRHQCRACMEADETPTHVMLQCRGVAEQRTAYLGSPASLPEALGDLGGLLSFWSELGWLE
ncbi:jg14561 [Pararge aegeria aegeria]|uniref:Jg14561 protein n=1 Tax=Pararge aegeria aegeria TaxID=348720 RepID=A0A8S4RDY8_9NEOP|nr:jg14561 [Pararge aegeria aegeria]